MDGPWRSIFLVTVGVLILLAGTTLSRTVQAQSLSAVQPQTAGPLHLLVNYDGPAVTIRPTYALPDTATADTTALHYDLTVERTGTSTARSHQSGRFTPAPGRVDTLSTVRVNAQPGDHLHLHLIVRRNDQIVAKSTRTDIVSEQK